MQEHERWLKIVEDDLKVAKALLVTEVFGTVAYPCQQAAEKSLKAYLVFKNYKVIKTHDLIMLVDLCCKLDRDFEKLYDDAEQINPFATKFRYPTEFDIPDCEDAKKIIDRTERIVNFVLEKIAEPETDQQDIF